METCLVPIHYGFRTMETSYLDVSHFTSEFIDFFIRNQLEFSSFYIKVLLDLFHFEVWSIENFSSLNNLFLTFVNKWFLDLLFSSSNEFFFLIDFLINRLINHFFKCKFFHLFDSSFIFSKESIERIYLIIYIIQRSLCDCLKMFIIKNTSFLFFTF